MKIEKVVVGYLEENCYILEKDNKVLIIDPGDEEEKIKEKINGCEVVGVLITHKHPDHIGALSSFKDIPIYSFFNLDEKEYYFEPFRFIVIKNPGHTNDSVSFYFEDEKIIFSGDFIFYESIGRCDLPTGSENQMKESINKIKNYPLDITIYPGHGKNTTLGHEIENNIYFK